MQPINLAQENLSTECSEGRKNTKKLLDLLTFPVGIICVIFNFTQAE